MKRKQINEYQYFNRYNWTALHFAANNGSTQCLKILADFANVYRNINDNINKEG